MNLVQCTIWHWRCRSSDSTVQFHATCNGNPVHNDAIANAFQSLSTETLDSMFSPFKIVRPAYRVSKPEVGIIYHYYCIFNINYL